MFGLQEIVAMNKKAAGKELSGLEPGKPGTCQSCGSSHIWYGDLISNHTTGYWEAHYQCSLCGKTGVECYKVKYVGKKPEGK